VITHPATTRFSLLLPSTSQTSHEEAIRSTAPGKRPDAVVTGFARPGPRQRVHTAVVSRIRLDRRSGRVTETKRVGLDRRCPELLTKPGPDDGQLTASAPDQDAVLRAACVDSAMA
jgi:hypothetical protein